MVGLMMDLGPRAQAFDIVEADFFGIPTAFPAVAANLARVSGAPIVVAAVVRRHDNTFTGIALPPIFVERTKQAAEDVQQATQAHRPRPRELREPLARPVVHLPADVAPAGHRRGDMIAGAAARLAEGTLPHLPSILEVPMATVGGTLAYGASSRARGAVRENLAIVAPERRDRERLMRQTFVEQGPPLHRDLPPRAPRSRKGAPGRRDGGMGPVRRGRRARPTA